MSTNTTRVNNPMKVITGPDTRWSYANVWEPKSINGGAEKYSVSLIIPKSDTKTIAAVNAAIDAASASGTVRSTVRFTSTLRRASSAAVTGMAHQVRLPSRQMLTTR